MPTHGLWQIIADTYYVYFLPSSFISFKKKVNDIRWRRGKQGWKYRLKSRKSGRL